MSWKVISCPHCGHAVKITVNDNVKSGSVHRSCSKCHKNFSYTNNYGRVTVSK